MKITVDTVRSKITELPDKPLDKKLIQAFTIKAPDAFFKTMWRPGWSGATSFISTRTLMFGTGLLNKILQWCKDQGIPVEITDNRIYPSIAPITDLNYLKDVELRDYQLNAINKAIDKKTGLIQSATGSGKCCSGETIISVKDKGKIHIKNLFSKKFKEETIQDCSEDNLYVETLLGYKKVKGLYKTNKRELLNINNGKIRGVPGHRILLTNGEWIPLSELKKGDKMVVHQKIAFIEYFCSYFGINKIEELIGKNIEISKEFLPLFDKIFILTSPQKPIKKPNQD